MLDPPQFPIIIGVTGHCDIAPGALEPVAAAVRALLKNWQCQFGSALHVMTALADGADQLVADEARKLCVPIPIIAVAPMPFEEYLKTLRDDRSRANCQSHWDEAAVTLELPELLDRNDPDYRDQQYEQLGVLLARRSHLLLALWNGMTIPADRCGTGAVVGMRRDGDYGATTFDHSPMFRGAASMLNMTRQGSLLHIFTPRDKAIGPSGFKAAAGECFLSGLSAKANDHTHSKSHKPLYQRFFHFCAGLIMIAGGSDRAAHEPGKAIDPRNVYRIVRDAKSDDFELIAAVNRQITGFHGSDMRRFEQQLTYLDIGKNTESSIVKLKRLQAAVDTAAQVYQGRLMGHFVPAETPCHMLKNAFTTWRTTGRTPCLGVASLFAMTVPIAVFFFELYAHREWIAGLAVYLAVFGGAAGFQWYYLNDQKWQNRFQDYRALAEGLRVQLYWALSTVQAAVPDHYLAKQVGELGWIQFAMRGPALWAGSAATRLREPNYGSVRGGWIENQLKYFETKSELYDRVVENGKRRIRSLLFLGLLTSILLLLSETLWGTASTADNFVAMILHTIKSRYITLFIVLTATFPALAAMFTVSREWRSYEAHAHSYALMARMFDLAVRQAETVNRITDPPRREETFRQLVRELGKEALAENAEWLVDHRRRPIEHKQ